MSQATFRFPRVHPQEQVRVTSDSDGDTLVASLRAGLNGEVPNYLGPDGVTTLYLQSEAGTATVTGDVVGDGSEAAPTAGTSVAIPYGEGIYVAAGDGIVLTLNTPVPLPDDYAAPNDAGGVTYDTSTGEVTINDGGLYLIEFEADVDDPFASDGEQAVGMAFSAEAGNVLGPTWLTATAKTGETALTIRDLTYLPTGCVFSPQSTVADLTANYVEFFVRRVG